MRFRPRAFCRRIKARRSKKGSHIESRRWRDGGSRANRVAGGFSPPAPTTPRVRVRTGLFLRMGKGHRKMTTSHAGYGTSRQDRFIRSGAIRPLRSGRLAHTLGFIFTRTAPTAPVSAPPPALPPLPASPPSRPPGYKNRFNCSGIFSTSFSSPAPSVTAASPGLSQNCTTTSPRAATRSSHGPSSRARA